MKLYGATEVDEIISLYNKKEGEVYIIDEGSLVYGLVICTGYGLKTAIIKEKYLNEWSSANTVRFYNKMPKKYEKILSDFLSREEEI